jgi:4-hydroxy-tetrahydrodipicolinate synthase
MQIAKNKPNDFLLISGDDLLTPSLFAMGGSGVISVLANGFPSVFKEMCKTGLAGDLLSCSKQAFRLLAINPHMYSESNPVGIKHVLKELGVCDHHVRLPLLPPSLELQEKIREIMHEMD